MSPLKCRPHIVVCDVDKVHNHNSETMFAPTHNCGLILGVAKPLSIKSYFINWSFEWFKKKLIIHQSEEKIPILKVRAGMNSYYQLAYLIMDFYRLCTCYFLHFGWLSVYNRDTWAYTFRHFYWQVSLLFHAYSQYYGWLVFFNQSSLNLNLMILLQLSLALQSYCSE